MDAAERTLLGETVSQALVSTDGTAVAVDAALAELGWLEMLRDEPRDAVAVVFGALGATNAAASALDDVVLAALGIEPGPEVAVLLPSFGTTAAPGTARSGITTSRMSTATDVVVVVDGGSLSTARVPTSEIARKEAGGVDPSAGLYVADVDLDGIATDALDAGAWSAAVAAGQVALAHQIVGACRVMLELARTHALERVQFGRPIGQFQAVRHRLADALVSIESAEAALTSAADAPGPMTAMLAKALAGRAARTAGTHCQQVLAGIGFTTDHAFHLFLKRTIVLDGVLGSTDTLTVDLGRTLLATREVPKLVEL